MHLPPDLVRTCPSLNTLRVATVVYALTPYPEDGQEARCWARKGRIADMAGVSARAVRDASQWLSRHGFIRRQRVNGNHSDWVICVMPARYDVADADSSGIRQDVHQGYDTRCTAGSAARHGVHQGYDTVYTRDTTQCTHRAVIRGIEQNTPHTPQGASSEDGNGNTGARHDDGQRAAGTGAVHDCSGVGRAVRRDQVGTRGKLPTGLVAQGDDVGPQGEGFGEVQRHLTAGPERIGATGVVDMPSQGGERPQAQQAKTSTGMLGSMEPPVSAEGASGKPPRHLAGSTPAGSTAETSSANGGRAPVTAPREGAVSTGPVGTGFPRTSVHAESSGAARREGERPSTFTLEAPGPRPAPRTSVAGEGNDAPGASKPRRRRGDFKPTPQEQGELQRVLEALWGAMEGMDARSKRPPANPTKTTCGSTRGSPGWLGRLRELRADGEDDPAGLLCAIIEAKAREHRQRDDPKSKQGHYLNGVSLCRDQWWPANLAAGRAELARRNRPKPRRSTWSSTEVAGKLLTPEFIEREGFRPS